MSFRSLGHRHKTPLGGSAALATPLLGFSGVPLAPWWVPLALSAGALAAFYLFLFFFLGGGGVGRSPRRPCGSLLELSWEPAGLSGRSMGVLWDSLRSFGSILFLRCEASKV